MVFSNKILLPTCAPAHGDIATYFFFEKIFRSDGEMCVSVTSVGPEESKIPTEITHFYRFLRRMALRKKFQKLLCAPSHGDIATYFFFEKIFRSDGEMCVSMTPFWEIFFSTDFFLR